MSRANASEGVSRLVVVDTTSVPESFPAAQEYSFEKLPIESFHSLSIEYLYHYIRFYSFGSTSDSKKMNLFRVMGTKKLRDEKGFESLLDAISSGSFEDLTRAVDNLPGEKTHSEAERWNIVLDGYFAEKKNPSLAIDFFRNLLFFPYSEDTTALKEFVDEYKKTDQSDRKHIISQYVDCVWI